MSTLAVAILSGIIGILLGVMLGRTIDPLHKEHQQQSATLKQTQQDLENLRAQVKEHFTHTAATLQQFSENARKLQDQLAVDALKISGLELYPAETTETEEYRLARLFGGTDVVEPPRDYAPKGKNSPNTLSEEYGLKD